MAEREFTGHTCLDESSIKLGNPPRYYRLSNRGYSHLWWGKMIVAQA